MLMLNELSINEFLNSLLEEKELFLVGITISPGKIVVEIDKDQGITISECESVNRALRAEIGEAADSMEIQVSSPGLDKPLRVIRQYRKNVGRDLSVIREDMTKVEGTLTDVTDEHLVLHTKEKVKQGKKKVLVEEDHTIPFTEIRESKIVVKF